MDQESTINYLNQSYKFRKLPVIYSLQIFGVKQIYNNLIYFLTLIDRYNIRKFSFGGRQTERYNGEDVISLYMQSLESSFPSKDVEIINWYFDNSSVDSLLELCYSVRSLIFDRCRFDLESDTSINNKGSNAEILTFSNCYQDDLKSMDLSFIKKIVNK